MVDMLEESHLGADVRCVIGSCIHAHTTRRRKANLIFH